MEYIYIPDSYNNSMIESKFKDREEFLSLQVLYRKYLESLLSSFVDFQKIDLYIQQKQVVIPRVKDEKYNFYHKYSNLGSEYLFLRNNFHVENLSPEEIVLLKHPSTANNVDFIRQTLSRVIFEEGDFTFFGPPTNSTEVKSKSIVFEFAYNQTECVDLKQLKAIEEITKEVFAQLTEYMKKFFNLPVSFLVYKSIPDLYYREDNEFVIL